MSHKVIAVHTVVHVPEGSKKQVSETPGTIFTLKDKAEYEHLKQLGAVKDAGKDPAAAEKAAAEKAAAEKAAAEKAAAEKAAAEKAASADKKAGGKAAGKAASADDVVG